TSTIVGTSPTDHRADLTAAQPAASDGHSVARPRHVARTHCESGPLRYSHAWIASTVSAGMHARSRVLERSVALSEAAHSCPESTQGLSSVRMANYHGRVELWCEGSDQ